MGRGECARELEPQEFGSPISHLRSPQVRARGRMRVRASAQGSWGLQNLEVPTRTQGCAKRVRKRMRVGASVRGS